MQGFGPRPPQRSAPSPGPGWTTLAEPESEEEENEGEDMLDRSSIPPGPASRGSQQKSRGSSTTRGNPRPPAFGKAFNASLPPPGPFLTNPPPRELWLANTFNSIGGSQADRNSLMSSMRTRIPGELPPLKSRSKGKDGNSMMPPTFSASQLSRGDSSTSSSSRVASASNTPSTSSTPGRSTPLSAKPYSDKQTARKTTGTHKTIVPSASQASTQAGTFRDKGKGKEKALPSILNLASARANGTSTASSPSTAPPRFTSSFHGAGASTARSINAATDNNISDDEELPDAAQLSTMSQARRMAGKSTENMPKPSDRLPSGKERGDEPRKALPSLSLSSYSRPPPSTQPAPRKFASNDRMESVSAPPATQPNSLSRMNLDTATLIDLSSPEDEEIEVQRLQKWKEEATRNGKGKQPRPRQSGTPPMIDLTLEDSPPPRRQTARKSTGFVLSPPRKAVPSSQRGKGKGNVAFEKIIDLTCDDPVSPRQTARKSTGQRQQPQNIPPPQPDLAPEAVKGSVVPPYAPHKAGEIAPVLSLQTANKAPGPDAPQKTDSPNSSANPRSPRQTARKVTGQVQMTLTPKPISHQTARKSTGQKPPIHKHQLAIGLSRERELPGMSSGILSAAKNDAGGHQKSLKLPSSSNNSLDVNKISVAALQTEDGIDRAEISRPPSAVNREVMVLQPTTPASPITSPVHSDVDVQMADSGSLDYGMEVDFMPPDDDAIPQIEFAVSEVHLDDNTANDLPIVLPEIEVEGKQIDEQVASEVGNEISEAKEGKLSDKIHFDITPTDDEDVEVDALLSASRSPSEHSHFPLDINLERTPPNEDVEGDSGVPPTSDLGGTPPILATQMAKLDLSSAVGSQTPDRHDHQPTLEGHKLDSLSRGVLASFEVKEPCTLLAGGVQGGEADDELEPTVPSSLEILPGSQPPLAGQSLAIPSAKQVPDLSPQTLPSNNVPSDENPSIPSSVISSDVPLNNQVLPVTQAPIKSGHGLQQSPPPSLRQYVPVQMPPTLSLRSTPASSSKELRPGSPYADPPGSSSSVNQTSLRAFPLDIEPVRKLKTRGTQLTPDNLRKALASNAHKLVFHVENSKKSSNSSIRGPADTSTLRPLILSEDNRPDVSQSMKGKEPMIGEKQAFAPAASPFPLGSLSTIRKMLSESSKQGRGRERGQSRRTSVDMSNHTTRTASPVTSSESSTTINFAARPLEVDHTISTNVSTSIPIPARDLAVTEPLNETVVKENLSNTFSLIASPAKRPYPPSESEHEVGGNGTVLSAVKQKANKRLRSYDHPRTSPANNPVPPSTQLHSRSSSTDSTDDMNLLADIDDQDALVAHNADHHPPEAFPEAIESIGREFASRYCQAKDLPHKLADVLNAMPKWEWAVYADTIRQTFESAMMSSTTFDEPDAPCIKIINDVDDDIIPPSEFCYTNLMWHGDNIPPPDISKLKGCDCVGRCDPKSRNCICLQRAKLTCDQAGLKKGFLYDTKGRLRTQEYPIYECNELCGCTEDCWNRVVQKGRKCSVNIVKTETKGWGIFAGRRIPSGTFVGIYSGEIITDEEGERRGLIYNKVGRTYLFDIDFWHISEHTKDDDVKYTIDAFHAGNFTRFLNHSCDPNCKINAVYINETNIFKPLLAIFTTRDVDAGEELCFSYYGEMDADDDTANNSKKNTTTQEKKGDVWRKCECGARRCRGFIFSL